MTVYTPAPESMLPAVWAWMNDFSELMIDDHCPKTFDEMCLKHESDLQNGAKEYLIATDNGTPLGAIWAENAGDGMYLGHLVFSRYDLKPEQKTEVARKLIEQMFAHGARKIIWQMFAENRPFRIFLRRLGAEVEGILKQGTRKDGKLRDIMLMASFPKGSQ